MVFYFWDFPSRTFFLSFLSLVLFPYLCFFTHTHTHSHTHAPTHTSTSLSIYIFIFNSLFLCFTLPIFLQFSFKLCNLIFCTCKTKTSFIHPKWILMFFWVVLGLFVPLWDSAILKDKCFSLKQRTNLVWEGNVEI